MKKSIKLPVIIALITVIGFSMTTCDNGNDAKGKGKLHNIDITGARALMVAPRSAVSRLARSAGENSVFLKQLNDGAWVEVRITDEEGAELQMEPPSYIFDATEDWMIIGFNMAYIGSYGDGQFHFFDSIGNLVNENEVGYYLVNKLNGDVYDFKPAAKQFGPHFASGLGEQLNFKTDKNGNIYYGFPSIIKVTIGETQATAERLTSDVITVQPNFAVDSDGNILYRFSPQNGGSANNYRVRTVDGTIIPVNVLSPPLNFFSFNGTIYAEIRTGNDDDGYNTSLCRLEINGNSDNDIQYTPVFSDNRSVVGGSFFYFPDKMVVIDRYTGFIASFSKNGTQKLIEIDEEIRGRIQTGSKDFFVFNNNEIYTIDPETGVRTTLVSKNEYDTIYYFEVTYNDIVIINALTFGGKKILANIYPDGRREIISENFEKTETVILEKVR